MSKRCWKRRKANFSGETVLIHAPLTQRCEALKTCIISYFLGNRDENKDGKTNTFTYFGSPVVVKYKFDEKIRDESYDRVMNFFDKHK